MQCQQTQRVLVARKDRPRCSTSHTLIIQATPDFKMDHHLNCEKDTQPKKFIFTGNYLTNCRVLTSSIEKKKHLIRHSLSLLMKGPFVFAALIIQIIHSYVIVFSETYFEVLVSLVFAIEQFADVKGNDQSETPSVCRMNVLSSQHVWLIHHVLKARVDASMQIFRE